MPPEASASFPYISYISYISSLFMLTLSLVLIVTSISPSLQYTDSEFYLNFSYNNMTNKAIAPVLRSCNSGAITAYNIFMEENTPI